ncbi:hypothetical protein Droror1_Dr00019034 [Drosera rotundifolia]
MPTAAVCVSSSSTSKRSNPSTATRKATSRTSEYSKSSTDKKLSPNRTTTRSASLRRSTISDIDSDEFLHKQDNPLFWTAAASPPSSDGESIGGGFRLLKKLDDEEISVAESSTLCKRRGRRLSRNSCAGGSDAPEESLSGRSLSNVVVAEHQRWRSVSRGGYPNHEHSEDGGSYTSISEAEEKRILPDMDLKATRRSSDCQAAANKITNTILADIENPDSMGFMDVRSEYSKLLEESQDRAKKLLAELAVEEQRGIELTRILKQIITEPKTPNLKKSHVGRKGSIERRKISKCLEEEAMAYFDECVSISTFDGSDVSFFEDPPCSMVGANGPRSEKLKLQEGSTCKSSISCSAQNQDSVQIQPNLFMEGGSCDGYAFAAICNKEDPSGRVNGLSTRCCSKQQFSSTQSLSDASTFEQDIRNLGKLFPKEYRKAGDSCHIAASGHVDMDEYSSKVPVEQFLFDRVTFKNRIESGSLLLCGGGMCSLFSPYASGC